jgi:hypothetical protein
VFVRSGKERYIYVDERVNPREVQDQNDLEAVDELIQRIREARVFICILGGKSHGSPIRVSGMPSTVSFFEVELFQAALLQKPVHIFVHENFNPEPRFERLLAILRFYFPEWVSQKRLNNEEIIEQASRVVNMDHMTIPFGALRHFYRPIRRLVQGLYADRGRGPRARVRFLEGEFESRPEPPRRGLLEDIIDLVRKQPNEEKRLSRLWIGIRELMASPYHESSEPELLQYWNLLLGEWGKAGAWYGLHGDTPLGCLAAFNSMADVRSYLAQSARRSVSSRDIAYPGGPLASSKYSIGKLLFISEDRKASFAEALEDIKSAMKEQADVDEAGLRAIRGSIYRQLGAISDAIVEYEAVLRLRQDSGASESAIGEALSELGFAYLRNWSLRRGLIYCEEGVEMLRQGARPGFLVRGLKKLAVAYACNGKLRKALEAWREARDIATTHGTYNQL